MSRNPIRASILTYPIRIRDDVPVEGKFLQIRLGSRDYLIFAAAGEHRYHNQILARFLSQQGIPHHWEGAERLVVSHSQLAVAGGGRFRLDPVQESLRVWDSSSVYGRFDAARLAAQLAGGGSPWDRLALLIE
jgi:hypothetical protein